MQVLEDSIIAKEVELDRLNEESVSLKPPLRHAALIPEHEKAMRRGSSLEQPNVAGDFHELRGR